MNFDLPTKKWKGNTKEYLVKVGDKVVFNFTYKEEQQPTNYYGATKDMLYYAIIEEGVDAKFLGFSITNLPDSKWLLRALKFVEPDHTYL